MLTCVLVRIYQDLKIVFDRTIPYFSRPKHVLRPNIIKITLVLNRFVKEFHRASISYLKRG